MDGPKKCRECLSEETRRKTDAIIARSCKEFSDERFEKRLKHVDDGVGKVFAGVEDLVEYAFELVHD
jgi:hypothetical protein